MLLLASTTPRTDQDIEDLDIYFRENPFFKNNTQENGKSSTEMIYKVMGFEAIKAGDYVMKIGEMGTKFYIILRGKVSVRTP
jgi:hypothetical protein